MDRLIARFAAKLVRAGICAPDGAVLCARDDAFFVHPGGPGAAFVTALADRLGAGAAILVRPARPDRHAAAYFAREALRRARGGPAAVFPRDCETRTFFHDLPVLPLPGWPPPRGPEAVALAAKALSRRKGILFADGTMAAPGPMILEQAFVTVSSMCFACAVKFFSDYLALARGGCPPPDMVRAMGRVLEGLRDLPPLPDAAPALAPGPFAAAAQARAAMAEAGRLTVRGGLVDSAFGNVSALVDGVLHISRTGAALDELEGQIDACPLDGSSCAALTASSEFSAHARIVAETPARVVLHGHPKFSVILSMDCDMADCPDRHRCHTSCRACRFVGDAPVVPGEVGCGPRGLARTLPPALHGHTAAMVHGHGVFTVDETDFNRAFAAMLDLEKTCRDEVLERVAKS
jgi:ribulose-5-phosphate 4-epimerase/fuculose-1-phosphate aldolase